jgi:hypothetical protein
VDIAHVFQYAGLTSLSERAVLHVDIFDGLFPEAHEIEGHATLFGPDVLDEDISHAGREVAGFLGVFQIHMNHGFADFAYGNPPNKEIFEIATTKRIGFEANSPVQPGAVHAAVLDVDVPNAPTHFTSQHYTPVPVGHVTVLHHDVFAGDGQAPTFGIATGFDGDTVISRVEATAFNEHISTGFGIAAVIVRPVTVHGDVANDDFH